MNKQELENLTNQMQEKLGKENAGLIADDIGILLQDNDTTNSLLANKDKEIEKLKQKNENLLSVNGNLLQQVGMQNTNGFEINKQEKEEKPKFSLKNAFDEKGNFK